MTLANKLTFFRIVLSPVFFIVYFLPAAVEALPECLRAHKFFPLFLEGRAFWTIPVLWLIFIVSEITDLLDGIAARKRGEVSDFGKFFDPFADTLMQITVFICFVIDGIFPAILFLIVLYREFSILFIRNLMLKNGFTLGASMGGKIKTVVYIIAGGAALLTVSVKKIPPIEFLFPYFKIGAIVIFIASVILSLVSFFNYLSVYRKTLKQDQSSIRE